MDKGNCFITITSYGKEIVNIAKIYTEEQKYSGINESLNYKLIIFIISVIKQIYPKKFTLKHSLLC